MGNFLLLGIPSAPLRGCCLVDSWDCRGVGRATRARLARGVGVASWRSNAALLPRNRGQTCSAFASKPRRYTVRLKEHWKCRIVNHRTGKRRTGRSGLATAPVGVFRVHLTSHLTQKIGNVEDALPSQSVGLVLRKFNTTKLNNKKTKQLI